MRTDLQCFDSGPIGSLQSAFLVLFLRMNATSSGIQRSVERPMLLGWRRKALAALIFWTGSATGWALFRRDPFDPSNTLQGLGIGTILATTMVAVATSVAALWQASRFWPRPPEGATSALFSAAVHALLLLQIAIDLYLYFRNPEVGALGLICAIATAATATTNILISVFDPVGRR